MKGDFGIMIKKTKKNVNLNMIIYSSNDTTTDSPAKNIMVNLYASNIKKIKQVII